MTRYGSELEKVSHISADGSYVSVVGQELQSDKLYELTRLSQSEDTYIASGFNTFIVKLKNPPK